MVNFQEQRFTPRETSLRPGIQFLIFTGLFIGVLFIGNLVGIGIAAALYSLKEVMDVAQLNLNSTHAASILWILQTAGTTFPILAAPVFFATFVVNNVPAYLKVNFRFTWKLLPIVLIIMFISFPA